MGQDGLTVATNYIDTCCKRSG